MLSFQYQCQASASKRETNLKYKYCIPINKMLGYFANIFDNLLTCIYDIKGKIPVFVCLFWELAKNYTKLLFNNFMKIWVAILAMV